MPAVTRIRNAEVDDAALLLELIKELAVYEKLLPDVTANETLLAKNLFGPQAAAHALIAEADGVAVGFAIYFYNFSTFVGKPGIYLEDLYVRPEHRGLGLGKALLLHLVQKAVNEDCGRMEWSVLDWNQPSIAFYKSLGARPMDEWTVYHLDREAMGRLV